MPVYHFHHGSRAGWTLLRVLLSGEQATKFQQRGCLSSVKTWCVAVYKCVLSESGGWTEDCIFGKSLRETPLVCVA